MKDVIIIGAGPCGLTSALYTANAGLSTVILEKSVYGGQLINTAEIDNYPGVGRISGYELAQKMYSQLDTSGVSLTYAEALSIEREGEAFRVKCNTGDFTARCVIIANGASRRLLGCEGEHRFTGRGVSYCAVCDGNFFRGKEVCVVGGGNSALEEALYLSGICSRVWLIHRRGSFSADARYIGAVDDRDNITVLYHHTVTEVCGDDRVRSVKVKSAVDDKTATLNVSAMFVAVGCVPENVRFSDTVSLSSGGYILAGEDCRSAVPGIFAAGDTREKHVRQIVTAVADGGAAALAASDYIRGIS